MSNNTPRFAFFGTPEFATIVLDELESHGFTPAVIVTAPDAPKGRKLLLTPSEVRVWAEKRNIPVLTPNTLRDEAFSQSIVPHNCNLFIVTAYGKIIPKDVLSIPKFGTLNVHPSLLPKFRGSSPVESAIISKESGTGVSIMLLDEEMDHGPILAQRNYETTTWPPRGSELTVSLAHLGGKLLAESIPLWLNSQSATKQNHELATFTKKISKSDGLINLSGDPVENYKKIRAYDKWPGAYFFVERKGKNIRVRIDDAIIENESLTIISVTPEGKSTMHYEDFLRGTN